MPIGWGRDPAEIRRSGLVRNDGFGASDRPPLGAIVRFGMPIALFGRTNASQRQAAVLQYPAAMLCFFNLAGAVYEPDDVGCEVATIDQARLLAVKHVAEIIQDQPEAVWTGEEVRLEVTDERRLVLFTVIVLGVDAAAVAGQPSSFRPNG